MSSEKILDQAEIDAIAGRVNQHAPVDRGELFRMTERIAHRGPDDAGYHLRTRVGLGHRLECRGATVGRAWRSVVQYFPDTHFRRAWI